MNHIPNQRRNQLGLHDSFDTSHHHLIVDSRQSGGYDSTTVTTVHNSHASVPADIRRALDEVAQALSVIAPVTARVREKLGDADEDAAALESSVDRAVQAIRRLQPRQAELVGSAFIG
jgi:hypothetical protein